MAEATSLVRTVVRNATWAQSDTPPTNDRQSDASEYTSIDTSGFVSLLRILGNFRQHRDSSWGLVDIPNPENLHRFCATSKKVRAFRVYITPSPMLAINIKPATLVRVARMLGGRPLLPNLQHLRIEGVYHNNDDHLALLALLASPALENVTLSFCDSSTGSFPRSVKKGDIYQELVLPLFTELVSYSPKLKVLLAKKVVPIMPISWLRDISAFRELRVLKLECTLQVPEGELTPYLKFLKCLRSLETLWLRLEETPRAPQETSRRTFEHQEGTKTITLVPERLSVTQLNITGPARLISNVISNFGSEALHTISVALSLAPDAKHNPPALDLSPLKKVSGLRSFLVSECTLTPSIELVELGVWPHLISLALPSSTVVDFPQLQAIAKSLPSLRALSVRLIDLGTNPPVGISVPADFPLRHPLETLKLLPELRASGPKHQGRKDQAFQSHLVPVARYLNALFPRLQSLTAGCDASTWGAVFELMKLCQASLVDDRNRKSLSSEA